MAATTFLNLKLNALKMVDHPVSDSVGLDRMGVFINQTLNEIYSMDEGRRFVEDTLTLATVASTEYVAFSTGTPALNTTGMPDEIRSVYQTTDDIYLKRWTMAEYRKNFPDVSTASGNPTHYARWRDRLYLYPRPSGAINLLLDIWVSMPDLAADGNQSLLDKKYDEWILAGAAYRWVRMIEPDDSTKIASFKAIYDELTAKFGYDLTREPSREPMLGSHRTRGNFTNYDFVTPAGI